MRDPSWFFRCACYYTTAACVVSMRLDINRHYNTKRGNQKMLRGVGRGGGPAQSPVVEIGCGLLIVGCCTFYLCQSQAKKRMRYIELLACGALYVFSWRTLRVGRVFGTGIRIVALSPRPPLRAPFPLVPRDNLLGQPVSVARPVSKVLGKCYGSETHCVISRAGKSCQRRHVLKNYRVLVRVTACNKEPWLHQLPTQTN